MEPIKISKDQREMLRTKSDVAKFQHWWKCYKARGWRMPVEFGKHTKGQSK